MYKCKISEKTKSSASAGSSWNYKVSCWSGCGALKILVTTSSGDPELDVGYVIQTLKGNNRHRISNISELPKALTTSVLKTMEEPQRNAISILIAVKYM
jgi:hypothetical protein